MHKKLFILLTSSVLILALAGCAPDPDQKANELFVTATQMDERMREADRTPTEAYKLYQQAMDKLDSISSDYPSSNLAVQVRSGNTKMSGLTYSELRQLQEPLKRFSEADQDAFKATHLVIQTIDEPADRVDYLLDLGVRLQQHSRSEHAYAALAEAHNYLKIEEPRDRFDTLSLRRDTINALKSRDDARKTLKLAKLATAFAKTHHLDDANNILAIVVAQAEAISEDDRVRRSIDTEIARTLVKLAEPEKTRQFIQSIDNPKRLANIQDSFVNAYIDMGNPGIAEEIATQIDNAQTKQRALFNIAIWHLENGQIQEAESIVAPIDDGRMVYNAKLAFFAKKLGLVGIAETAEKETLAAIQAIMGPDSKTDRPDDRALYRIALMQAHLSRPEAAQKTAEQIQDIKWRAAALISIAELLIANNKTESASLLEQAEILIDELPNDDWFKIPRQTYLTQTYIALGSFEKAISVIEKTRNEDGEPDNLDSLILLAEALAERTPPVAVQRYLSERLKAAIGASTLSPGADLPKCLATQCW